MIVAGSGTPGTIVQRQSRSRVAYETIRHANGGAEIDAGGRADYETVGRLDNAFHAMFIDHRDNARLREIMYGLNQEVLRYQLLTARLLGDVDNTVAQHLALTRLLKEARRGARPGGAQGPHRERRRHHCGGVNRLPICHVPRTPGPGAADGSHDTR
jgi:hypothetical protein